MLKRICAGIFAASLVTPASAEIIESFQYYGTVTQQSSPYTAPGFVSGTLIFNGTGSDVTPIAAYITSVEGTFSFAPPVDLNFVDAPYFYAAFDIAASGDVLSADFESQYPFPPTGETRFDLYITDTYTSFLGATSYYNEFQIQPNDGYAGVEFTVPEPASVAIFLCGLLGLMTLRRWRSTYLANASDTLSGR